MRDTIELARKAGIELDLIDENEGQIWYITTECLKVFEALVRADERNRTWTQEHWTEYERSIAAAEREACAMVCESRMTPGTGSVAILNGAAAAIRARGNT